MAERRMLAKAIIESDAFYDLSHEEQVLYLHLSMNADDDGIVDNPKAITRSCGLKTAVLEALAEKRFILELRKGLVIIKHWKINNYIQKDRYKPTAYTEEMADIAVKENGAYTEAETMYTQETDTLDTQEGDILDTQETDTLDTQYSIGKNSIGKNSIGNNNRRFTPPTLEEVEEYCKERGNTVNPEQFVDFYSSKGWMVGKNKMKDWKACVRTWEKGNTKHKSAPAVPLPSYMQNQPTETPATKETVEKVKKMMERTL